YSGVRGVPNLVSQVRGRLDVQLEEGPPGRAGFIYPVEESPAGIVELGCAGRARAVYRTRSEGCARIGGDRQDDVRHLVQSADGRRIPDAASTPDREIAGETEILRDGGACVPPLGDEEGNEHDVGGVDRREHVRDMGRLVEEAAIDGPELRRRAQLLDERIDRAARGRAPLGAVPDDQERALLRLP